MLNRGSCENNVLLYKWLLQPWKVQPRTLSDGCTNCEFQGLAETTNLSSSITVFLLLLWLCKRFARFSTLPRNCGTGVWSVALQCVSAKVICYQLKLKTLTDTSNAVLNSQLSLLPILRPHQTKELDLI